MVVWCIFVVMFFFVFLCLLSYFWVFLGGLSYLLHAMTRRQTEPESSAPLESKDSSAYRASIVLTCANVCSNCANVCSSGNDLGACFTGISIHCRSSYSGFHVSLL